MHVLIADSQPLFRQAFAALLEQNIQALQVECVDRHSALMQHLASGKKPHLLIYDLRLPDANGFAGLVHLNVRHPDIPVLILAERDDDQMIRHALLRGAVRLMTFMTRMAEGEDFLATVRQLLDGEFRLPVSLPAEPVFTSTDHHTEVAREVASLPSRRFRILMLLREGLLNKQIASELSLSESTIKTHVSAIMKLMLVRNRTQAVIMIMALRAYPAFTAREAAVAAEYMYVKTG